MTGKISTMSKKPYQVIPRTLGASPYLEPPINLINKKGRNGKSKAGAAGTSIATTRINSGVNVSSNNPYHLRPNMEFGQQEERNAELRRISRERRSSPSHNDHNNKNNDKHDHFHNNNNNIKQQQPNDNGNNNHARMILLPCEVDLLIEQFGLLDDDAASAISKRFGTVEIIPDNGSMGSDCLLKSSLCDDYQNYNKDCKNNISEEDKLLCGGVTAIHGAALTNEATTFTATTLPELSSIKSCKSSSCSSDRGKEQLQSENDQRTSDIPPLVLPKIQQAIGASINPNSDCNFEISKTAIVSSNSKQHTRIDLTGGSIIEDNHAHVYRDDSFEAVEEEEEVDLDSFEAQDEDEQEIQQPLEFKYYNAHTHDADFSDHIDDHLEEEERLFREQQRHQIHK